MNLKMAMKSSNATGYFQTISKGKYANVYLYIFLYTVNNPSIFTLGFLQYKHIKEVNH